MRWSYLSVLGVLATAVGCLSIRTPDVQVELLSPLPPRAERPPEPTEPRTPYADTLERVVSQQNKVSHELDKGDWGDLIEEADDWVKQVRTLSGYAEGSYDPPGFRKQCDVLLRAIKDVRRAARQRDSARCQKALDACDPLLDRFCRTFPLTVPDAPPQPVAVDTTNTHRRPAVP